MRQQDCWYTGESDFRKANGTGTDIPSGYRPCPFCHAVIPWGAETCPVCGRVLVERFGSGPPRRSLSRHTCRTRTLFWWNTHVCGPLRAGWRRCRPQHVRRDDFNCTTSRGTSWQVFRPASARTMPSPDRREVVLFLVIASAMILTFIVALFLRS